MPTYEYRCKTCGQELEVVQSFTDDALTTCEACGGPLRKVFGNVGIAFKGSGFYKNDSRGKSASTAAGTDKGSDASSTGEGNGAKKDAAAPAKSDGAATPAAPPKADKPKAPSTAT